MKVEIDCFTPGTECWTITMHLNVVPVRITDTIVWMRRYPGDDNYEISARHNVEVIGDEDGSRLYSDLRKGVTLFETVEEAQAAKQERLDAMRAT